MTERGTRANMYVELQQSVPTVTATTTRINATGHTADRPAGKHK